MEKEPNDEIINSVLFILKCPPITKDLDIDEDLKKALDNICNSDEAVEIRRKLKDLLSPNECSMDGFESGKIKIRVLKAIHRGRTPRAIVEGFPPEMLGDLIRDFYKEKGWDDHFSIEIINEY